MRQGRLCEDPHDGERHGNRNVRGFPEHIFEDFSREQTSTESGQFGTGLGMAIVKKIVDLMGEI